MTSTAIYRSLMEVIERRRSELGLSMAAVDDLAGTQDGYYAKMIYPDTPSGRQARWETVDLVVQALFGREFGIDLSGNNAGMLSRGSIQHDVNEKSRQIRHWRHSRHFKNLSAKGVIARQIKLSPAKRRSIARKAAKTRWKRAREAKRKGEAHKAVNAAKAKTAPPSEGRG